MSVKYFVLLIIFMTLFGCSKVPDTNNFQTFSTKRDAILHRGSPQERQRGQDKLFHIDSDSVVDRSLSDGEIPFDANAPDME